jgi:hypothetical protein
VTALLMVQENGGELIPMSPHSVVLLSEHEQQRLAAAAATNPNRSPGHFTPGSDRGRPSGEVSTEDVLGGRSVVVGGSEKAGEDSRQQLLDGLQKKSEERADEAVVAQTHGRPEALGECVCICVYVPLVCLCLCV